jgi:transcriptional regulator with XRE-family HTH domain
MSQQEAADRLNYNHRKISRIEKGQRPDYHGMRAMLDQYGIPVSQWDEYMDLYAWALEQGWWTKYDLGDHGYISLEHDAYRMRTFELAYVPGLLQVEDYIRHITAAARVRRSGRSVDNQVAVRLRRQERLVGTDPLVLHAVMAEPALAKADRPQLMHIVERGRLPNVTVQVIPDRIGPHDGDNGAFTVLDLSGREKRSALYVEHAAGSLHIENPGEVKVATLTFTHLSKLALSPDESAEWIAALAAER